jgi:AbrB family looped-hinge helix DNA binding protein
LGEVGKLAEVIVDEKNRVTLPREMRRRLGIASGMKLEVDQIGAEIVIRPVVPIRKPTESIWGLAKAAGRNPKRQAREAIAKRERLGK